MKSKYELAISSNYVPGWTYVEAIRELFQNALDNETQTPSNKMLFEYDNGKLRICNKNSQLELDSLLLGSTTKANDVNTIGKHGEGYKIAFTVLLRENKHITVYNYRKREIWTTKLIKSKRYNGQMIPCITIEKEAFWKEVPDNDLTIEVDNITDYEYCRIVQSNLNLRLDDLEMYTSDSGDVLLAESEKGNLYVKGLFVCRNEDISYGYNFPPKSVRLDRDRKMISDFDVAFEASRVWRTLAGENKDIIGKIADMISLDVLDVKYLSHIAAQSNTMNDINECIVEKFVDRYGENAVPVVDDLQYNVAKNSGYNPIITKGSIRESFFSVNKLVLSGEETDEHSEVYNRLSNWIGLVEKRLDSTELSEINSILEEIDKL